MTPQYRKLPGKRRGFFNLSSVWAGPDHLLLIRGSRFREEYKRFYYRDVQSIAVARAPRFHFSTRSAVVAAILISMAMILALSAMVKSLIGSTDYTLAGLVGLALALVGVWVYISAAQSCRCRIYTAVSSDELPSIYRLWTARKFLDEVEPLIAQTQGTIVGEWAAAAEVRPVGPEQAASEPLAEPQPAHRLPRRVLASDLFLLSLVADGVARLVTLPAILANWLPYTLELATIAGSVAVIVQHNRRRLRAGMHIVAIASLIGFGILYYVQAMSAGISASMTAARTGQKTVVMAVQETSLTQNMGAGIDAILLVAGLIISLRED